MVQQCFSLFYQNNCVEIIPYTPEKLVYKYSGQPQQTIFSTGGQLSYTFEEKSGQCSGDSYKVVINRINNGADPCYNLGYYPKPATIYATGKILGLKAQFTGNFVYSNCDTSFSQPPSHPQYILYLATESEPFVSANEGHTLIYFADFDINNLDPLGEIVSIENLSRAVDCIDCIFKVFETFYDSEGIEIETKIRHEETQQECPEVELIEPQLDYSKAQKFDVETSPLGYLESNNFVYSFNEILQIEQPEPIPPECINLYQIIPYIAIGSLSGNADVIRNLITQVCSAKSAPPPKVIFQCDKSCNPEDCPENTCRVECGDHICCYDSSGKSIKEILL